MASGRRGPSGSRPCIECMSRGFESALTKNMRAPGTSILPIDAGQPGGTPPIKVAGPESGGWWSGGGKGQPWPGLMLSYHSWNGNFFLILSEMDLFLKLKFACSPYAYFPSNWISGRTAYPNSTLEKAKLAKCIRGRRGSRGSRWQLRFIFSSTLLALFQRPLSSLPAAPSKPLNG